MDGYPLPFQDSLAQGSRTRSHYATSAADSDAHGTGVGVGHSKPDGEGGYPKTHGSVPAEQVHLPNRLRGVMVYSKPSECPLRSIEAPTLLPSQ